MGNMYGCCRTRGASVPDLLGASAGKHARKFLRAEGEALTRSGTKKNGTMEAWVEYEAPTRVVSDTPGGDPRCIHQVHNQVSAPTDPCHNTDPWVFHPGFVWSICMHKKVWQEPPKPGDIVLFASAKVKESRWFLDTVFVIDKRMGAKPVPAGANYTNLVDKALRNVGYDPFVGRPVETMTRPFSFAPCKKVTGSGVAGFPRPCINDLLSQLRMRSGTAPSSPHIQSLVRCCPEGGLIHFWNNLIDLISKEDELLFGTSFELPRMTITNGPSSSARDRHSPKPSCCGGGSGC